jgi:hypothetical protein
MENGNREYRPYPEVPREGIISVIQGGQIPTTPANLDDYGKYCWYLAKRCWALDIEEREKSFETMMEYSIFDPTNGKNLPSLVRKLPALLENANDLADLEALPKELVMSSQQQRERSFSPFSESGSTVMTSETIFG